MQMVLNAFLVDLPRALGVWLVLLVPAIVALSVLLTRAARVDTEEESTTDSTQWSREPTVALRQLGTRRRRISSAPARPVPASPTKEEPRRGWRPRPEAVELSRFAAEVAVAADRSAALARRRREQWEAAQEHVERAWEAFQAADGVYRRLAAAAVLPTPRTPRTPAEYADRERHLRRSAMAACWRRELSILQLSDALAHRNGWDPRRHPVEQEIHLCAVVRDTALATYRAAAARERETWRIAEEAAETAGRLRAQAYAAAVKAWRAQYASAAAPLRPLPGAAPAGARTGGAIPRQRHALAA